MLLRQEIEEREETMGDPYYESLMGFGPKRIVHWEHWSNPDAATFITGIDFYEHPRSCMKRLAEMYPLFSLAVPESDDPLRRPNEQEDLGKGRWGHAYRDFWQQEEAGKCFASQQDMLRFSQETWDEANRYSAVLITRLAGEVAPRRGVMVSPYFTRRNSI